MGRGDASRACGAARPEGELAEAEGETRGELPAAEEATEGEGDVVEAAEEAARRLRWLAA